MSNLVKIDKKYIAALEFPAQVVPQLPWGHIVLLLQRLKNLEERE
jgi:hypothetical protein